LLHLINQNLSGLNFPLNSPKMSRVPSNQRDFCMELFYDQALSMRALNRLIPSSLNDCFTCGVTSPKALNLKGLGKMAE
jgi:hypothetical protein